MSGEPTPYEIAHYEKLVGRKILGIPRFPSGDRTARIL